MSISEAPGDPVAIAIEVGARLDALRVPWVTGGSIASSVHGEPRSTMDVDMVIALVDSRVRAMASAFGKDFYLDADAMREAVRSTGSFNAIHLASAVKIDFFIAGDDPFEAERLARRVLIEMPAGELYVDTAEHTLLRKLEWYRRSGEVSDRQWRDVQAIVRIQGHRLDRQELHRWSGVLGVTDLLEGLLRAASPGI